MGKSPSIQDLEARDKEFATYIDGVRNELNARADAMDQSLGHQITVWKAQAADARIIVTGRNFDFVHEPSFSFDRLVGVLHVVAGAAFTDTKAPPGTTVEAAAQKEVKEALGSVVEETAAIELFVAGTVIDLLGNIVYDFGTLTPGTFVSSVTSQYLDLGMRIFVGVGEQTCNSHGFFDNKTIYGYVYTYQVFYSRMQLQEVTKQTIASGLANQISLFEHKMRRLPIPDDPMSEQGGKYDALTECYRRHIADAQAQLSAMGHQQRWT